MHLNVILTTEVEDVIDAQEKTNWIKNLLTDHPEVKISSEVSEQIKPEPPT